MTSYIDLASTGIALGTSSGGVQTPWALIKTPAANSLQLQGSSASNLCKLSGLDQPAADADAANKLYVQQYVQSQIRGLQVKRSAQLCSKVPVSLTSSGAVASRWLTPTTWSGSNATIDL